MGIFRFSPGSCRKTCICTRCAAGTAPRYWTATILGTDYRLYPSPQNNLQNCVYELILDAAVGCGTARRMLLSLSETVSDYFFLLQVYDIDVATLHAYALFGLPSVDCQTARVLTKTGGTCGGSDTVTITPGPAANDACCACDEVGSSGAGGGTGGRPIVPPGAGCACCGVLPRQWQLEIPSGLWGNPTPSPSMQCTRCDVQGLFLCDCVNEGCLYVYESLNWCEHWSFCEQFGDLDLVIAVRSAPIGGPIGDPNRQCAVSAVISMPGPSHGLCGPYPQAEYRSDNDEIGCAPVRLYLQEASYTGGFPCVPPGVPTAPAPPAVIYATPIA